MTGLVNHIVVGAVGVEGELTELGGPVLLYGDGVAKLLVGLVALGVGLVELEGELFVRAHVRTGGGVDGLVDRERRAGRTGLRPGVVEQCGVAVSVRVAVLDRHGDDRGRIVGRRPDLDRRGHIARHGPHVAVVGRGRGLVDGVDIGLSDVFLSDVDRAEGGNLGTRRCRRGVLGNLCLGGIVVARDGELEALVGRGVGAVDLLCHVERRGAGRLGRLLVEDVVGRAAVRLDPKLLSFFERSSVIGLRLIARAAEHHVRRGGVGNLVARGRLGLLVAVKSRGVERVLFVAELCRAGFVGRLGVVPGGVHLRPHDAVRHGLIEIDLVKGELGALESLLAGLVGLDDGDAVARGIGARVGLLHHPVLAMAGLGGRETLHGHIVLDPHLGIEGTLRSNVIGNRERLGVGNGDREHRGRAAVVVRLVLQRVRDALGHLFAARVLDLEGTGGEARPGVHRIGQGKRAGSSELLRVRVHLDDIGDVGVVGRADGLLVQDLVVDGDLPGTGGEARAARARLGGVGELLGSAGVDGGLLGRGLVGQLDVAPPRTVLVHRILGRDGEHRHAVRIGGLSLKLRPIAEFFVAL